MAEAGPAPWRHRWGIAGTALLSVDEMYRADQAAMAAGVPGYDLMTAAGQGIAQAVLRRWSRARVLVLAGPGNNGGDGFVIARELAAAGWPVRLALWGARERLKGDAARAAADWEGPVEALEAELALGEVDLVVDALFGAGLTRPVEGAAAALLGRIAAAGLPAVAVDMPSGVHGDSGAVLGTALSAALTVTFARAKYGHLLLPGRRYCGELVVADIGIPESAIAELDCPVAANGPALWQAGLAPAGPDDHKYRRGHALVVGGAMSGAARLALRGARAAGPGVVTAIAPEPAATLIAQDSPGAIVLDRAQTGDAAALVTTRRCHAAVIGPGLGTGGEADLAALAASGVSLVVDADALAALAAPEGAARLADGVAKPWVLTPHAGEFRRLFPDLAEPETDKLTAARHAAQRSGAVVVLKGYDSVIAAPDGRARINANAPASLATAGTGDVLAGAIAALLARGLAPVEAASAGVWLHGAAAARLPAPLWPEDLPPALRREVGVLEGR